MDISSGIECDYLKFYQELMAVSFQRMDLDSHMHKKQVNQMGLLLIILVVMMKAYCSL